MTADTTRRNGSVSSVRSPAGRPSALPRKISPDESGPSGRTVNSSPVESSITLRDRFGDLLDAALRWLKEFLVPPQVLTEPPPAFAELTAYAYRGSWTRTASGFIRGLGTIWLIFIALPVIFGLRLIEWLIQRPTRALFFYSIWHLIYATAIGHFLAQYLFLPFWSGLRWIFF